MSDWQPIATAPQDGTLLWLCESGIPLGLAIPHQVAGHWRVHKFYVAGGYWESAILGRVLNPTHWMPLPPPPKGTA
jgi:hypothetical protein